MGTNYESLVEERAIIENAVGCSNNLCCQATSVTIKTTSGNQHAHNSSFFQHKVRLMTLSTNANPLPYIIVQHTAGRLSLILHHCSVRLTSNQLHRVPESQGVGSYWRLAWYALCCEFPALSDYSHVCFLCSNIHDVRSVTFYWPGSLTDMHRWSCCLMASPGAHYHMAPGDCHIPYAPPASSTMSTPPTTVLPLPPSPASRPLPSGPLTGGGYHGGSWRTHHSHPHSAEVME